MNGETVATSGGAPEFLIDDFITDPKLELDGVWRSVGKDSKGQLRELKLARLGNDNYNSYIRKKQRANQALLEQNDDESFKTAEEINKQTLAHTVIKGMRVNGVDVSYTPDIGIRLLANRDFHAKVRALADQMDPYKSEANESKS